MLSSQGWRLGDVVSVHGTVLYDGVYRVTGPSLRDKLASWLRFYLVLSAHSWGHWWRTFWERNLWSGIFYIIPPLGRGRSRT